MKTCLKILNKFGFNEVETKTVNIIIYGKSKRKKLVFRKLIYLVHI
jgi:hypothetical protein